MATTKENAVLTEASPLTLVQRRVEPKPPRIFLYGVHGIGKTSFAAKAPDPILICTEEGAEEIEVPRFPIATKSDEVLKYLRALYRESHSYQTVAVDSADWLEDSIQAEVRASHSASDLSYGKDSQFVAQRFTEVLTALNFLREKRGMAAIIIAHSEIKRFDSPMTEPYDRYQPKLQRQVSSLLQEWADVVLFATYDIAVKSEEVGFSQKVRRGISTGDRVIYTEERPAYFAKNRYSMPSELPLNFDEVKKYIPYYQPRQAKQEEAA